MTIKYRALPALGAEDIKRFWSKVDRSPGQGPQGECWLWISRAIYRSSGYGKFLKCKVSYGAHRIAYMIQYGVDPGEILVCHRCDVRLCMRADHLFKGTSQANADDMKAKGRSAKGDRNGMRKHPERTSPGEKNGYAKLTDLEVREICRAYDAGEANQYQLARRYQVWQMTISRIVRRASRKTAHVLLADKNVEASTIVKT
jgi:predicted DNA-binding protein (UPF0251 family)